MTRTLHVTIILPDDLGLFPPVLCDVEVEGECYTLVHHDLPEATDKVDEMIREKAEEAAQILDEREQVEMAQAMAEARMADSWGGDA